MTDQCGLEILYQALGRTMGIADLRPDDTGCCCLVFDQNLMVQIRAAIEPPRLVLSGRLVAGLAPGQAELLLRANAWGAGSCHGWFALDEQGRVCLQTAVSMQGLGVDQLLAKIETLLDTLEVWSHRLKDQLHRLKPQDSWQRI